MYYDVHRGHRSNKSQESFMIIRYNIRNNLKYITLSEGVVFILPNISNSWIHH